MEEMVGSMASMAFLEIIVGNLGKRILTVLPL